jgi:hypothetical protein
MALRLLLCCLLVVSCSSTKVAYQTTEPAPNDTPPSARFATILAALRDELPKHSGQKAFYVCVGQSALEALIERLPEYELHPASETYTEKDSDWPVDFVRTHVGDHPATRVHVQFDSVTESEIELTLFVASTYPNAQIVRYTFRRQGADWRVLHRERPETPKI